jgi:hypothetical protein
LPKGVDRGREQGGVPFLATTNFPSSLGWRRGEGVRHPR